MIDSQPKHHWFYRLLRFLISKAFNIYYKRIDIVGLETVPKDKPFILAINHQNALSDPLTVASKIDFHPIYLTRADIFSNELNRKILLWFKMIPIYRQRDGVDTLKKNQVVFDTCIQELQDNGSILIFPEGNHEGKHRVRPLKKGLARIAFSAAERSDFNLPLQIIPVGVSYSAYRKFHNDLTIWFGEGLEVSAYYNLYQEDSKKAIAELTQHVRKAMQQYTLHVSHVAHYETIYHLQCLFKDEYVAQYGGGNKKAWRNVLAGQALIKAMDRHVAQFGEAEIQNISTTLQTYLSMLVSLRIRDHVVRKAPYTGGKLGFQALGLAVASPLFLWGLIHNYLPYYLSDQFARKLKDQQFHSSIEFLVGFVLFPVWYLLLFVTAWIVTKRVDWALGYLLSLPLSGIGAIYFTKWTKKWGARWRYFHFSRKNDDRINTLEKLRAELQLWVRDCMKQKDEMVKSP